MNKTIYKIELLCAKYLPTIIAIIYLLNTLCSYYHYEVCEFSLLGGNNQKILMEAYIKILSTKLYDNIDTAVITDFSWLQLMAGVFGNFGNSFSNNIQHKEELNQLAKTEIL